MERLRAFFLKHRAMALAVIALALAMKALVPAGYMIGSDTKVLTIRICDGNGTAATLTPVITNGAYAKPGHGGGGQSMPDHQACPYSALAHGGLGGADPIQIALALAFIVLVGLAIQPGLVLRATARLRPPLRAPPLFG